MEQKRLYKLVLTGGPCGGKTTGQARLCTFFENLGWKVFRVPETATVLLSDKRKHWSTVYFNILCQRSEPELIEVA
ncbi:hypothetical protein APICC_02312 [Apis cerana cerana]|uniref:NadR/Ttd14 AAA domain-containing protein n=1 Tax=Apis cerana cerana TaxID=94128 RepID=A0A2A3ELP0_APICC|nr:hypothetical protein APICC_02312 [Apis cerana cerana]